MLRIFTKFSDKVSVATLCSSSCVFSFSHFAYSCSFAALGAPSASLRLVGLELRGLEDHQGDDLEHLDYVWLFLLAAAAAAADTYLHLYTPLNNG